MSRVYLSSSRFIERHTEGWWPTHVPASMGYTGCSGVWSAVAHLPILVDGISLFNAFWSSLRGKKKLNLPDHPGPWRIDFLFSFLKSLDNSGYPELSKYVEKVPCLGPFFVFEFFSNFSHKFEKIKITVWKSDNLTMYGNFCLDFYT